MCVWEQLEAWLTVLSAWLNAIEIKYKYSFTVCSVSKEQNSHHSHEAGHVRDAFNGRKINTFPAFSRRAYPEQLKVLRRLYQKQTEKEIKTFKSRDF